VTGYIPIWFTHLQAVTHPSTKRYVTGCENHGVCRSIREEPFSSENMVNLKVTSRYFQTGHIFGAERLFSNRRYTQVSNEVRFIRTLDRSHHARGVRHVWCKDAINCIRRLSLHASLWCGAYTAITLDYMDLGGI